MTSRLGSNSSPLMHGDQISHPREGKGGQIPGVCRVCWAMLGGGMLKLRFDRYITDLRCILDRFYMALCTLFHDKNENLAHNHSFLLQTRGRGGG